jgi:hypothetical protein
MYNIRNIIYILWHIDPLLGNYREINNETTAVARQRPASNNGSTVGSVVFYMVLSETISRDGRVQLVQCNAVE